MTCTVAQTTTYTAVDVGKVLDCFAADFDMQAQATGLRSREDARATSDDVKTMAKQGYLKEVNVYLEDETSRIVRAAKYEVSTDAALWTSRRPGNNLWPRLRGGWLKVYVVWSDAWWQLSDARREAFRDGLQRRWGTWDIDTSFPTLTCRADRCGTPHPQRPRRCYRAGRYVRADAQGNSGAEGIVIIECLAREKGARKRGQGLCRCTFPADSYATSCATRSYCCRRSRVVAGSRSRFLGVFRGHGRGRPKNATA
jgi:hypothetical protein